MSPQHPSLTVLLHDIVAGQLRLIDGKLSFIYSPEYLANPQANKLSFALPLQAQAFDEPRSKAFFGGLLPEGKLRTLLSKQFGVSKQNDFALLREIGGECAGAVSLLPVGETQSTQAETSIQWLNSTELAKLIEQLPQRPMLAGQDELRLSLAGAQDKLPVCVEVTNTEASQLKIGLPTVGNPSQYILKPPIPQIVESVGNEFFCMSLAQTVGIESAKTTMILEFNPTVVALLVERYDRVYVGDNQTIRLHQEDFCQALGISSDNKYQNEQGPSLVDCFSLVRQATNNSGTSVLNLWNYVIFNALVGNHDAHGKNFSILYQSNKARLAPLYDCLSTAIYSTLTDKMAMSIGGKYRFSELQSKHWAQFATDAGLSVSLTLKRLKAMAQLLPEQARLLQNSPLLDLADKAVIESICLLIEHRCALTLSRLS